jgi:hypothetical protein
MTSRYWIAAGFLTLCGAVAVSAGPSSRSPRRKAPARTAGKARPKPRAATAPTASLVHTRPLTLDEARTTAAMLGDAYDLLLDETHAQYHTRPSVPVAATVIRKVQAKMTELGWPRARFLAVNAVVMHPDHVPKDEFEKKTIQALRRGDARFEQVVGGQLRVSTVVSLEGSCRSCHWTPGMQSPKAATTWTIPLRPTPDPE